MNEKKNPLRWRKTTSSPPQFDLWRGDTRLALVWCEGGVRRNGQWVGGIWKWASLVSETGQKLQSGEASSEVGAKNLAKVAAVEKWAPVGV